MWRSLSPFWGEEYTVHLPLDFHHLALYVLDEDTVGCVAGRRGVLGISLGPREARHEVTAQLQGGGTPDAPPPSCRHDDVIGKISLSKEAIAADPRGEQGPRAPGLGAATPTEGLPGQSPPRNTMSPCYRP